MVDVAHWSAAVPFAYLAAFRRRLGLGYWLVALAFGASFVADTLALLYGGTWDFVPVYRAAQYALFALAMLTDDAAAVFWPVLIYAFLGTALYFGMVQHIEDREAFMAWWVPYQGTRLLAFGLFVRAAWRVGAEHG